MTTSPETSHAAALRDLLGDRVVTDPAIAAGYAADAYPQAAALDGAEFVVVRARTRAGRHPIKGVPLVADGILVVQTVRGDLSAYRLQH